MEAKENWSAEIKEAEEGCCERTAQGSLCSAGAHHTTVTQKVRKFYVVLQNSCQQDSRKPEIMGITINCLHWLLLDLTSLPLSQQGQMKWIMVCASAHDVFSVYLSWSCLDLVNHILRTWAEMIFTNRSIIIIALRKGYNVFFLFIQEKDKRPEGERDNEFLSNTRRWMEVNEEREKDWNLTLLIHSQIVDSSYRFRFRVLMRTAALMCDKNEILVQYYQQRFDTVINSALFLTSLCLTVEVLYCWHFIIFTNYHAQ